MPFRDKMLIRTESYKGRDAVRIEYGPLNLFLVLQVGGRLMGIQWHGQELAFLNPECVTKWS